MAKKHKAAPTPLWIGFDTEFEYDPKAGRNNALSYQAHLINPETGLSHAFIRHVRPTYRGKYVRLTLADFLVMVLLSAREAGAIHDYPRSIVLVGHFTRADLSMFDDFHRYLKRRLAAVQRTYVTTERRLAFNLPFPDGFRRVTVAVVDTALIAPHKSQLAALGRQINLPKLEIMPGYSIEEMERFRDEQPEAFDLYALRDAEIPVRYAIAIFDRLRILGVARIVPTIGSAGVALFKRLFPLKKAMLAFLGQDTGPNSDNRIRWKPDSRLAALMSASAGCFHGGLNQVFYAGYSPLGRLALDVDLCGAYTTALAALSWPDWSSARYTKSLDELAVVDAAMTFGQVKFRFPPDAKFPCLPVRARNNHGLIYPLEGEAWCCGPELVVARDMGAAIEVVHGWRVDWWPGERNPFASFSQVIAEGRKAANASGNDLLELLFKLLGNTLYGKVSQGVSSKRPIADDVEEHRIFDSDAGEMADLPPSSITCPAFAAWITSLVRATMSEALHRLPSTAIALQATTDGILFVGSESDIDTSGPVAQAFKRARALVTGDPNSSIWDVKHRLSRVIILKVRGMISVVPEDWPEPIHLAKAGARLPEDLETEVEQTRYAEKLYRERDYNTTFEQRRFTPLSEQHLKECDLISTIVRVRLSWEYDFKNAPVEPVADVEGLVCFGTRPWPTLDEFERRRSDFEDWRRCQHRVLKTSHDYADMEEWIALRPTRKAMRTNARGVLPNLARALVLEALRRPLCKRRPYREIAEILARATGCFVTERTIKDIRSERDRIPPQCVSHLSAADIAFARAYGSNPIAIGQLRAAIVPGSVAESQFFEIWEKRLAAPVLVIGGRGSSAMVVASSDETRRPGPDGAAQGLDREGHVNSDCGGAIGSGRRGKPQPVAVLSCGSAISEHGVVPPSGNVIDITGAIAVRITMGATATISRAAPPENPEVDYRLVYETRRKALARNLSDDEAHFRAFDHAVSFCREHSGCDLEKAKALVRAAIAKAAAQ
jgi:hypothetical protein